MNKKVIAILMVLAFLFGGVAYGQTNDLPEPGMLPDSPFYFLKNWSESIGTFFTFDDEAKVERYLDLSERRLSETRALAEKGNDEMAVENLERYNQEIENALSRAEEAREKGKDTDDVLTKVSEATLRHQEALSDVYERVPEEAKEAVERAMERSMRGHEEAMKAISAEKRGEIMQDMEGKRQEVEQRLEGLREEGVPVPEIPTREDVDEMGPVSPEDETPEIPTDPEAPEELETPEEPPIPEQDNENEVETPELPEDRDGPETPDRP